MKRRKFKDICQEYGLVDKDGNLLDLTSAFCKIYYVWDMGVLQDFMNAIMEAEAGTPEILGLGESIFDDD